MEAGSYWKASGNNMLIMTLGLALFVLIHLVPTAPELRSGLVQRMGEGAYKGLFSLVALAGFALIVAGYAKGKHIGVWTPPAWGRHATMALMLPVFPLLVMAYLPGRFSARVRHPMITAVKLWALAHLLVRGDLKSLILFGGLLAWAVYDRISLKSRERAGLVTIRSGPARNDVIALVIGLALYLLFVKWGHPYLIGVPIV
ncbi:MAG: NnrU family protein [Hyphomicrobiaceae bacterium]